MQGEKFLVQERSFKLESMTISFNGDAERFSIDLLKLESQSKILSSVRRKLVKSSWFSSCYISQVRFLELHSNDSSNIRNADV